ncbi:MAG: GAF domain-containing sensor histidine kinase [Candidatus Binatia bacterium]
MVHSADIEARYRADTAELVARGVPQVVLAFLTIMSAVNAVEWFFMPQRRAALVAVSAAYLLICTLQIIAVRRMPSRSIHITALCTSALGLAMNCYFAAERGTGEICALLLSLFMSGMTVFHPWGQRGQLLGSLGAVLGFPLALLGGAVSAVPPAYATFAVFSSAALTILGARLLDERRFAAFKRTAEIEHANALQQREQEFSNALLEVGRALNTTIADPDAMDKDLARETQRALDAGWVALYRRAENQDMFRAVAVYGAEDEISGELFALNFDAASTPDLFESLRLFEAGARNELSLLPEPLLHRWGVREALTQPILRGDRIIGFLVCAYCAAGNSDAAARQRLLRAIANSAAVAFENARLVQEARSANEIKSEFVSTLSHELRTPLNVILGYTDILLDGIVRPVEPDEADPLRRIRDQAIQLNEMVQEMLDLNRLEARVVEIAREEFTLGELFDGLKRNVPTSWRKDGVDLDWHAVDTDLIFRTDRGKVERILRNLVHNALKFTEQGSVRVEAEAVNATGHVRFSVTDSGPGILEEDRPFIFEMFRQGGSVSARGGGVGLGLFIVKRLVDLLGGEIAVDSHRGAGTKFTISLPVLA